MQTTDTSTQRATATVGESDISTPTASALLDLLTTPDPSLPIRHEWSWPPRHTLAFIRECDQRLLLSAIEELGTTIRHGNWFPFEVALTKRLNPLQESISKTMLASLALVPTDSSYTSIMHGGYQIHLDTLACFWLGHPETKANLKEMITSLLAAAPPFTDEGLNLVAIQSAIHGIATGTLDLPHFIYEHLHPEFLTLSCHPSLQAAASRRLASQESTRGSR